MPLPDSVTACRGQNRMLLQSHRCSAILAQALGHLFLRQKVAIILKTATEQNSGEDATTRMELLRSLWPNKGYPIAKRREAALPMRTWGAASLGWVASRGESKANFAFRAKERPQ